MPSLEPVATALARGPMPLSQCAKIVMRLCDVLEPIHAAGRAHGAVTPDNVHFHQIGGELTISLENEVAPDGRYTAPERILGSEPSTATDVYTLGVLFFHMISGRPPFDGDEDEVRRKHVHQAPPPLAQNQLQDIPEPLEQLVAAMLSKKPSARPTVAGVGSTVENLDLDSTVMGVRLEGVRQLAKELKTENETLLLESVQGRAPMDDHASTDASMVDPYADTLIKNRVELGLEQVEGDADTSLAMDVKSPISDANTRIIEQVPNTDRGAEPLPEAPSAGSRALFGFLFGLVVIGAAVGTYLMLVR